MNAPKKILVVEDDAHIRLGLVEALRGEGFSVETCERGDQAVATVEKLRPTLLVLDVMLPGVSGYDVCKVLREKKARLPILMLTAKSQEVDKVAGLNLGADDYMTKPFGVRELLARIQALLRRSQAPESDEAQSFKIGGCEVNPKTFELRRGKKTEELSHREIQLLRFFHAHPGVVLSRERLLNEVWGVGYFGTTRTLDQAVVQLRKKLGDHAANAKVLLTVHGVGYRLAD